MGRDTFVPLSPALNPYNPPDHITLFRSSRGSKWKPGSDIRVGMNKRRSWGTLSGAFSLNRLVLKTPRMTSQSKGFWISCTFTEVSLSTLVGWATNSKRKMKAHKRNAKKTGKMYQINLYQISIGALKYVTTLPNPFFHLYFFHPIHHLRPFILSPSSS